LNPLSYIATQIKQQATGPCRLPAPLSWAMLTRCRASKVQRGILREHLNSGSSTARLLEFGVALVFWPGKSFAQALSLTRQFGGQTTVIRSRYVQFMQQIYLAWFHGISPRMYYEMGVVAAKPPVRPMAWLQDGHAGLFSRIFRNEKTLPEINDKLLFAKIMGRNGVPAPSLLAAFDGGKPIEGITGPDFVIQVERCEALFVKPVRSSGGKDSFVWEQAPAGGWLCKNSSRTGPGIYRAACEIGRRVFSSTELLGALLKQSRSGALMVQRRLLNHPELPQLGGSGLISLRVLSGFGSQGIVPLRAVLYLPYRKSISSQNGLKATVDLRDGRLGRLFHSSADQRFTPRLPETGTLIEGTRLPCWPEVLSIVESAHNALSDYAFLGWDVAICPGGPVILEANGNFACSSLQKPGARPLIDEKFLAIFDYWRKRERVNRAKSEKAKR